MIYQYPFGQAVRPVVQQDRTPKKVFVLGVYASAVHARWKHGSKVICQALAVASEPRIFWDGNIDEAKEIIGKIDIPKELGTLEPAGSHLNGPSARVLDEHILATLGFHRKDAWLCDLLPETRLNKTVFCDEKRCNEILAELKESQAKMLILLGDIPISQFLNCVADVPYTTLQEYTDLHGYGNSTDAIINGQRIEVLPLAHPRQIGALGAHSEKWNIQHQKWEDSLKNILYEHSRI